MTLPPSSYLVVADVRHQEICLQLLSLVHLLRNMHSAVVSDIQGGLNTSKIACWSDLEVNALVDYLYTHRAERGDSGNFKDSIYAAAADHIKDLCASGKVKDVKSVQNKWIQVHHSYPYTLT